MTTIRSLGTETSKIVHTQDTFSVFVATIWPMSTKTTLVPRALFLLGTRIYMEEGALLIGASVKFRVEETFRHFGHVIDVQEFAFITLLTQASKPVFANDGLVAISMSQWA